MAGHSHWAKIKRAKGANDVKRGRVWSKIARKLIIAAKAGGGDPKENLQLRYTIDEAKQALMPKGTIDNAVKKGTGELGGEAYEPVTYEGYGPGGVALLVETLTNNRSRTAPDLRVTFERGGGNLGTTNSVARNFSKKGVLLVKAEGQHEDTLIEKALDAGAEDVQNLGEVFEIITAPTDFHRVKDALVAGGLAFESADLTNLPLNTVAVDGEIATRLFALIDKLEENDDVQNVSHNAEVSESVSV